MNMSKEKIPITAAVRQLRQAQVEFTPCLYAYEDHGGTARAAKELELDEHQVIKTLLFADQANRPLIMLMHGDKEVSAKNLARALNRKQIELCPPALVTKLTGYQVGGVSPFGTLKAMPVYVEAGILALPRIYINGGKRGFLVGIAPAELERVLKAQPLQAAY